MEERAQELGGRLEIRSAPGTGTTVAPRGRPVIRILIVDDHGVVREGLRAFLELQDGLEVVGEAADGETGIAEAERLKPDVILMDPGDAEARRGAGDAGAGAPECPRRAWSC